MSLTDPLHVLDTRRSVPSKQLGEPGPDHATLLRMLASAVRVPDHGKLVPFRFIRLQGEARHALGDLLAARTLHLQPDAADAVVEKDRARFSHAPVIVTVVARLTPGHKVPEQEQLLTAGSVCFALLQAAEVLGFGAKWLAGWMAYDDAVAATLGLSADERIAGFIHIGTPKMEAPERERPDPTLLLTDWTPGA